MHTRVEVLLAAYKGENYIDEQIESILAQTHQDLHLIIRDDKSPDKTPEKIRAWAARYPDKVTAYFGDENLGAIGNFSWLLEKAQAPYIMLSDGDDVWLKDKVAKTLAKMHNMEKQYGENIPLLVHTDLAVVDKQLNMIDPSFWDYAHLRVYLPVTLNRMLLENMITGCTIMLNQHLRELAVPIPIHDVVMHDAWLGLITAAFGYVGAVPDMTMWYRQHGGNHLGARKFNFFSALMRRFFVSKEQTRVVAIDHTRRRQAAAFLERFYDRLSPKQKELILVYLQLRTYWSLKKRYMLFKYDLYRRGIVPRPACFRPKIQ